MVLDASRLKNGIGDLSLILFHNLLHNKPISRFLSYLQSMVVLKSAQLASTLTSEIGLYRTVVNSIHCKKAATWLAVCGAEVRRNDDDAQSS